MQAKKLNVLPAASQTRPQNYRNARDTFPKAASDNGKLLKPNGLQRTDPIDTWRKPRNRMLAGGGKEQPP